MDQHLSNQVLAHCLNNVCINDIYYLILKIIHFVVTNRHLVIFCTSLTKKNITQMIICTTLWQEPF